MQRVRHVERSSGQRFDRRPSEPVPGQVQRADGYASIDRDRTGELGRSLQSILPRAREYGQLDRRVASREQRADELMCVLAYAAPLAQRGTVIDHDAHLFKSFRVGRGPTAAAALGWSILL